MFEMIVRILALLGLERGLTPQHGAYIDDAG